MKFFNKLFHNEQSTPGGTVVPDDLVEHYPDPPEKIKGIIRTVPDTGIVLYLYKRRLGMSKTWKYWALDLMENGLATPGIVQLAGEDLNMNPFEFANLTDTIIHELDIDLNDELAYHAYIMCIANQVLRGEITARRGFEILSNACIETNFSKVFDFYYTWLENADCVRYYSVGGGMDFDNTDEWMHQYFEKLVKANKEW